MKKAPRISAVGRRRMLKLARLLEKDAKDKKGIKFDMWTWGFVNDEKNKLSCQTTACAMGLAALSGAFRSAGLVAKIPKNGFFIRFKFKGRRLEGVSAAVKLFGISRKDAQNLFTEWDSNPAGAKAELAMAQRLRDYVHLQKRLADNPWL